MVDSATLTGIELNSMDDLGDPVHDNHLLDILFFEETILSYLKLLVVFHMFPKSVAFPLTVGIETATKSLKDAYR